jgi:hypothetical protein
LFKDFTPSPSGDTRLKVGDSQECEDNASCTFNWVEHSCMSEETPKTSVASSRTRQRHPTAPSRIAFKHLLSSRRRMSVAAWILDPGDSANRMASWTWPPLAQPDKEPQFRQCSISKLSAAYAVRQGSKCWGTTVVNVLMIIETMRAGPSFLLFRFNFGILFRRFSPRE